MVGRCMQCRADAPFESMRLLLHFEAQSFVQYASKCSSDSSATPCRAATHRHG